MRTIQKRWVDRETDGRVKSRLVFTTIDVRAYTARDVFTNTVNVVYLVSVLESLNYHPLLTDPSCFRNDETNTNIFVHVDDGSMFGPKSEVLK